MGFYRTLKVGQQYLNIWPLEPKLGAIFPENRIIKATLFAQKMMPFLTVLFVVWQQIYARGDNMALLLVGQTCTNAIITSKCGGFSTRF